MSLTRAPITVSFNDSWEMNADTLSDLLQQTARLNFDVVHTIRLSGKAPEGYLGCGIFRPDSAEAYEGDAKANIAGLDALVQMVGEYWGDLTELKGCVEYHRKGVSPNDDAPLLVEDGSCDDFIRVHAEECSKD